MGSDRGRITRILQRFSTLAKTQQNQWGEFSVQDIGICAYGYSVSSVFAPIFKESRQDLEDDDDDPVLMHLRFLNYRYIQFCFHPLLDKFVLCSDWQDPSWTCVKSIRAGLDGDERIRRGKVFGKNQIDVQQKSLLELLVDEVSQSIGITSSTRLRCARSFTLSMFSKLPVSYYGHWTNITITPLASSLYLRSA